MLNRFVTLSVGGQHDLTAWAHVSILSAMAWAPPDSEFCIVTDQPESFGWFGDRIRILRVDAATLWDWRGRHDFFWRIELMCVVHAAALGPANVIYHDSDVLMRKDLSGLCSALSAGDVFMHEFEYELSTARRRGQRRLWRQIAGREVAGYRMAAPRPMWNAGLIAVGSETHALLDQALVLLDGLMDEGVRHNLVEQLAISTVFGATARLRQGRPWMDHFWANKDGYAVAMDRQLAQILTLGLDVDSAVSMVRREPILLPLVVRKRWWSKLLARVAGHGPPRVSTAGRQVRIPLPAEDLVHDAPSRKMA
ncbi:MAG: hypothetical protein Q8N18_23095 [Opitutaceae bacterium]|nr:hypothetical protein [Opitutaceae bacterium]